MKKENSIRHAIRVILLESYELAQESDYQLMCALLARFGVEETIKSRIYSIKIFLESPNSKDINPDIILEVESFRDMLQNSRVNSSFFKSYDFYDVIKNVSPGLKRQEIEETFAGLQALERQKFGDEFMRKYYKISSIINNVLNQMAEIRSRSMSIGDFPREKIISTEIKKLRSVFDNTDPEMKELYMNYLQALVFFRDVNFSNIDPEYQENLTNMILSGPDGVIQAYEIINILG